MSYDHTKQYRCTIVRGKTFTDLDDLLPAYANIINFLCPCNYNTFKEGFNNEISIALANTTKKTLDNHRTEIAGKLFGMYYKDEDDNVYASERTLKLLEDHDQPAFFKDLCNKYQFPAGISKITTVADQIDTNISIRQLSYTIKALHEAHKKSINLTKREIGYYILNSLDVLQGNADPLEVLEAIIEDRNSGMDRKIYYPDKPNAASSYKYQHINEQIGLLILSNLVEQSGEFINLNLRELEFIELLGNNYNVPPNFDFSTYDLNAPEGRKLAELDWGKYFSELSEIDKDKLITKPEALSEGEQLTTTADSVALGDEGELYVYNLEKARVETINPRLTNKIKMLGKTKGIGYDIQSVYAEGENPEFATYIEVKTTRRVTAPIEQFTDTINLTRNEWVAAKQYGMHYSIFRVYFTKGETVVFKMSDPYKLNKDGCIRAVATNYRMDFNSNSGGFIHNEQN